MVNWIWLIVASVVGAILYRMGGADGYNTKVRDAGVTTVCLLVLAFLCHPIHGVLTHILVWFFTGLATFGSLTSYFKKKGTDATWINWLLVGLATGIAVLPYTIATHMYIQYIVRIVLLCILIPVWSCANNNVVWEECGRGALIVATLGVFL